MNTPLNNSYNARVVKYEEIHSIDEGDFSRLIEVINPQDQHSYLDLCCGYGAVTNRIVNFANKEKISVYCTLLDSSELQISRAKQKFSGERNINFILADACSPTLKGEQFDTVIIKMGLHEVSFEDQEIMLREAYRLTKKGGKIVLWELALDEASHMIFNRIIREKDQIAHFSSMMRNRYFPKKGEVFNLLSKVGFSKVCVAHDIRYRFSARNRKDELVSSERQEKIEKFGYVDQNSEKVLNALGEEKVTLLRKYLRESLTSLEKDIMGYEESSFDSYLNVKKAIFCGTK